MSIEKLTKKHFVFDLDDTLTDSYDFNQQMFVDTFKPYLDLSNSETDKFIRDVHYTSRGSSMIKQFEEVIKQYSLNLSTADLMIENEKLHIQGVADIRVFDAVVDIVKAINESGRQASICSNRQTQSLMKILENNGLRDCFTKVVSCSDAGHEKPDPFCLLELIEVSGQPKDDFIYFGDSKTDYLFASSAGVDFIVVDHYINQKKFYKMILQSFM